MSIDKDKIKHVSKLARISVDEKKIDDLTKDARVRINAHFAEKNKVKSFG